MATMMMTAETPKMMPRVVRSERSLCRWMFFRPRAKVSTKKFTTIFPRVIRAGAGRVGGENDGAET